MRMSGVKMFVSRNDVNDSFKWGPAFWHNCLRLLRKIVRKTTSCQDLMPNTLYTAGLLHYFWSIVWRWAVRLGRYVFWTRKNGTLASAVLAKKLRINFEKIDYYWCWRGASATLAPNWWFAAFSWGLPHNKEVKAKETTTYSLTLFNVNSLAKTFDRMPTMTKYNLSNLRNWNSKHRTHQTWWKHQPEKDAMASSYYPCSV